MKKNVLKILSILILPSLLSGCRSATPDDSKKDDDSTDKTDTCSEFKSKKIEKQYVLNYDWNYSYFDFASNSTFKSTNLITSKSQLTSGNSFISSVYQNQFRGDMNPNGDSIGYDIFEEYDDAYFEDHILIVGSVYEKEGCTLYTTGVDSTNYKEYKTDSDNKSYLSDIFTPFRVDTVFDTPPIGNVNYRLILFVYDEFQISTSAYKNKTKSEIVSYFTDTNNHKNTRLKYYNPKDYYKKIWNIDCPDNKIE